VPGVVRVGLCCRSAHADSGCFGRRGWDLRVLVQSASSGCTSLAASRCEAATFEKWNVAQGTVVRWVCPCLCVVAEFSERRQIQTSPTGLGRWGPRGSSPWQLPRAKRRCQVDQAATLGWPNGLRRAARKRKASGVWDPASFHGRAEEQALTGRQP
jgi:hypothetical protein